MKRFLALFILPIAASVLAQAPAPAPPPSMRGDIWQLLTPQQREQLWRSLSPEQKADIGRAIEQRERGEWRERAGPGDRPGGPWRWGPRLDPGDGNPRSMMTPEERQQMREQIREAHRQRRERLDAERPRSGP